MPIKHTDHFKPIAIGVALTGLGFHFVYTGFRKLTVKRAIENVPTSKVRSAAMGPVELKGRAAPGLGGLLKSPFSGEPCVFFKYRVEERRYSGRRAYWHTRISGTSDTGSFFLMDETGLVEIQPAGVEAILPSQKAFTNQWLSRRPISQQAMAFLDKAGHSTTDWFGLSRTLRLTETFLCPNEKLYVMGFATPKSGASGWFVGRGEGVSVVSSNRSGDELRNKLNQDFLLDLVFGFVCAIGGVALVVYTLKYYS